MLKTISAALLAASVIAAPAFATETTKTTAPVIKADQTQTKALKSDAGAKAADVKADTKTKAMNANAAVTPAGHKTVRTHRHHHKQVSAKKPLKAQPDVTKPATADKRS
ncbi:hypothetical protein JQ543_05390 [Bradyrhizobium diazoefficiens]|nr:hypothetical protein [Bradyrhizobium diazoefficiens]MBR0778599.1 hypothetical protein [Bradyrhizobium diazoefficiens]MBR0847175.1 hypothetical protein [Bradyrhizobium diazoefficiens]